MKKVKSYYWFFLSSILIVIGIFICLFNYISQKKIFIFKLFESEKFLQEISMPQVVEETSEEHPEKKPKTKEKESYIAVLEIPKIGLKQGFYALNSPLNTVDYNITIISPSNFPNVNGGNLILASHSGNSPIAYFRNLYKTENGNLAFVYYNKMKYTYKMVNRYDVPKVGYVDIHRDKSKTTLTLITCTHNDSNSQTIIIAELLKTEPYSV